MGKFTNNGKAKKIQNSQEESEQEEQSCQDQQNQSIDTQNDSIVLQNIEEKIIESENALKLTWGAIYKLKKQQKGIKQEMQKQIEMVKCKYESQRKEIVDRLTKAVNGQKLEKNLYSNNQLLKSINLNQTKPMKIDRYWGNVFMHCGLIICKLDQECMNHCDKIICSRIQGQRKGFKLSMLFHSNNILKHQVLNLEVFKKDSDQVIRIIDQVLELQKVQGLQPTEDSLLQLLFGKDCQEEMVLKTVEDIYSAYMSSMYFYFHDPEQYTQQRHNYKGNEDEGQSDQDDDSSSEVKPTKKRKTQTLEKPQGKQQ